MTEPAVLLDNVWKQFRRGERQDSLRDLVPAALRRLAGRPGVTNGRDAFWAVRGVSMEVRAGEAVGVIGPNGAGKSTLLKLLTRILRPTRGTCHVRGRVGALIEVAAGFHPDLTGRENVFLQGAVMGMKRAEISTKFDRIVDFSGVGEFIDTPVKRYSSGMNARLGFSIAAHLDPDVLLVDEVLSVGDAAFQEQCEGRMKELIARGVPLLFISHNLPAVLSLCTRTVVLDRGEVQFDGPPAEAMRIYRRPVSSERTTSPSGMPAWIAKVELLDAAGHPSVVFRTGEPFLVRVHYATSKRVPRPHFAVDIHRSDGVYCAGVNTQIDGIGGGELEGNGSVTLTVRDLPLLPGCYAVSIGLLDAKLMWPIDKHMHAYPFSIVSERRDFGLVRLSRAWSEVSAEPASCAALAQGGTQ